MLRLSSDLHGRLDDRVISLLNVKGISTVPDFLRTDSNKLKQYVNIDLPDIAAMKNDFWKAIGMAPINGFQHYEILNRTSYIPTGIDSLDKLLNGGFVSGALIDICGFASAGKTQLYTTIAVNWAENYDYETFVVDIKGDFSGDRINRILLSRGGFYADKRKQIMRNIRVEKCNDPTALVELISNLLSQVASHPKLKLLVIDSLPALWFLFHGNKQSIGKRKLATLANLLRKIAVEHDIVVVTVNIETRMIFRKGDGEAIENIDHPEFDVTNRTVGPIECETTVLALGKHWKSICAIRLKLQRPFDASNCKIASAMSKPTNDRTICILKSNQTPTDIFCVVHLTDAGII